MNILIYKGNFQYGVGDLFIEIISDILRKRGYQVIIVNLYDSDAATQIINLFSTKIIDCVIGLGGIGSDIKIDNNQSIYDAVNTIYLAIFIDHPVHLFSTVIEPIRNYLISFVDKEHVTYVNEILPQNHKLSFFLPHGGLIMNKEPINNLTIYKEEKKIEILFSGTYLGEIKKSWENDNFLSNELIEKVCEKLIFDDYSSVHKTFYEVFEAEGIKFSLISKAQLSKLFVQIITYVRQYKRNLLIERIIESGLNITICGKNWDGFIQKHTNIDYRGALSIQDTLELIRKSKVLVNSTPNFTNGSHERVFTGMLNNVVVFSDKSKYYDKYFKDTEDILYYSFNSLDKDIENLKSYLSNDEKLFQMSKKAYCIVDKHHRWENRVDKILQMIELSKNLDK
jgi:hypothetical protein